MAAGGNGAEEEGEGLLARLGIDLAGFIDKYNLAQDASEELKEIFSSSYRKMQVNMTSKGPRYRWDQVRPFRLSQHAHNTHHTHHAPRPPWPSSDPPPL